MYPTLLPDAIGLRVKLPEALDLAAKYGFEGCTIDIREATDLGVAEVADLATERGVRLAAWGFPVDFRSDEAHYASGMAALPELAMTAAKLGVLRTSTWIVPCSDVLTYRQNFDLHANRLRPAAEVLADYGIWLGLEYVGPKTLWSSQRYPFAHTMAEMEELCAAVGPNSGFLLDSFHWHTAHETVEDLRGLDPERVVEVHLNDAPDVPRDEQLDQVRTLPGATGVIDIATFLGALSEIGYDGPVGVEPFSPKLQQLTADQACAATAKSLQEVWAGI